MFSAYVECELRRSAEAAGLEPAALLAVAEIVSDAPGLVAVNGRSMPPIGFEPHVFHRRLRPEVRAMAARAGLASPAPGALPQPPGQTARYALLARAALIDREAAHAACLWGVGRAPGEHARALGYESAETMAADAISGVEGQARVMLRWIAYRGVAPALERRDWAGFLAGYGGGAHLAARAERLARAHERWSRRPPPEGATAPLGLGDSGRGVARLQRALRSLGFTVGVDGVFGPETRVAVLRFQAEYGLVRDGVAGPSSWARLREALARGELAA